MEAFIGKLVVGLVTAAPGIYQAVRAKDSKLAKRRAREFFDTMINEEIAKQALKVRSDSDA